VLPDSLPDSDQRTAAELQTEELPNCGPKNSRPKNCRIFRPKGSRIGQISHYYELDCSHIQESHFPLLSSVQPLLEMSFTYLQLFAASLLSAIVYLLLQRRQRPPLPFPPGPRGLPLIGNLRDIPDDYLWLRFEKLGQDLGKQRLASTLRYLINRFLGSDILHLAFFGTHLVVLNSEKASNDLLEKRSSIYSDRYVRNLKVS
jgi:hypothetical protein